LLKSLFERADGLRADLPGRSGSCRNAMRQ
jgi:hypothetical protein